ncbi:MAG: hypothetical protein B7W97_01330, partial [Mycobacterium sp. 20-66-4]
MRCADYAASGTPDVGANAVKALEGRGAALVAKGLPAGPGGAKGQIVFTAADAVAWTKAGKKVILVREETNPEDVEGMRAAVGILTARGGMTSHAALVARGWGKPCVVGCDAIRIDEKAGTITIGDKTVKVGEYLTIDGATGEVMLGQVSTVAPTISGDFAVLMGWADKVRTLKVRTNA